MERDNNKKGRNNQHHRRLPSENTPTCCFQHGDIGSPSDWFDKFVQGCSGEQQTPQGIRNLDSNVLMLTAQRKVISIPMNSLARTACLDQLIQKASATKQIFFPVGKVCGLHQKNRCTYGKACNQIHLCRQLWGSLQTNGDGFDPQPVLPPPAPSAHQIQPMTVATLPQQQAYQQPFMQPQPVSPQPQQQQQQPTAWVSVNTPPTPEILYRAANQLQIQHIGVPLSSNNGTALLDNSQQGLYAQQQQQQQTQYIPMQQLQQQQQQQQQQQHSQQHRQLPLQQMVPQVMPMQMQAVTQYNGQMNTTTNPASQHHNGKRTGGEELVQMLPVPTQETISTMQTLGVVTSTNPPIAQTMNLPQGTLPQQQPQLINVQHVPLQPSLNSTMQQATTSPNTITLQSAASLGRQTGTVLMGDTNTQPVITQPGGLPVPMQAPLRPTTPTGQPLQQQQQQQQPELSRGSPLVVERHQQDQSHITSAEQSQRRNESPTAETPAENHSSEQRSSSATSSPIATTSSYRHHHHHPRESETRTCSTAGDLVSSCGVSDSTSQSNTASSWENTGLPPKGHTIDTAVLERLLEADNEISAEKDEDEKEGHDLGGMPPRSTSAFVDSSVLTPFALAFDATWSVNGDGINGKQNSSDWNLPTLLNQLKNEDGEQLNPETGMTRDSLYVHDLDTEEEYAIPYRFETQQQINTVAFNSKLTTLIDIRRQLRLADSAFFTLMGRRMTDELTTAIDVMERGIMRIMFDEKRT